jgi:hypothetical protein
MQITKIMETLHYDNGKPLSCDEYNYFDHYDRDQDFFGFFEYEYIYDFITDGKDLYVRVDMSFDDLEDKLRYNYDGASWDHDFNEAITAPAKKPFTEARSAADIQAKCGKGITEDWYGADSEVEFEPSVYPDIAKYFGLKDNEVVTYAYYYTDEVIVNYEDATGRSYEIEKHVPLDQVEEWFKAGYTVLNEANGDICTVYFKHDPSTAIFTGSK